MGPLLRAALEISVPWPPAGTRIYGHLTAPFRTSPQAKQAIKVFEEVALSPALRLDWVLRPGDVQLLSNHVCLHSREGFADDPQVGRWAGPGGCRQRAKRVALRVAQAPGSLSQLALTLRRLRACPGLRFPPQDPALQRHLLRLWLAPPEERPLPAAYCEIMQSATLTPGQRGGIATERRPYVPLEATA